MWKCRRCNKENQDSEEKCINCGHGKTMDYTGHRSVSRLRPEMTNNWKKKKEKPMLMADCLEAGADRVALGGKLLREKVCEIDFVKMNLASIPSGAWDVSEDQSGTIWAWAKETPEGYILYIGSEKGVYANKDCEDLFYYYLNVKKINFNNLFDTSRVTNMGGMFWHCESLIALDLNNFDTRNVINMESMFDGCESLIALDLNNFDTRNVTDMCSMFGGCKNLKSLDVSRFDTRNVTAMTWMFDDCESLEELDVGKFKTDKVKDMGWMFHGCKSLKSLDVSRFDVGNVEDMKYMFYGCESLEELDVGKFKTDKVKDMSSMFGGCKNLKNLNVSRFDTRNVTDMGWMFYDCKSLKSLDVSRFDVGNVEDMRYMFYGCESLEELDVGKFKTDKVKDMSRMFNDCKSLKSLDVSRFDTRNVTDMSYMFYGCKSLEELDVSHFKTGCVTNMEFMFCNCANLTQLDILNFYYAPDVNTQAMFTDCGVSKDNTALDLESEPRTLLNTENSDVSKEQEHTTESLNVLPPTLPVGCYYAGDSIKEICADFLSHQKNTIFDNGRKNKKWVLCHALGIPSEEKIYLLHDASLNSLTNLLVGKIAVAKAEGFAITDKGIYMKKEYDKRKVFMSWERLKEANIDIDYLSNVRVDEIPIAFSYKGSVDRAKLQELVYLFYSIRRFLNGGSV